MEKKQEDTKDNKNVLKKKKSKFVFSKVGEQK